MTEKIAPSEPTDIRPLSAVGLDDVTERVYRHLLDRATSMPAADVAADLGLPAAQTRRTLAALETMGLISQAPTRPPHYTAMAPQAALEALVQHHLYRLSAVRTTGKQLQERFHATVGAQTLDAVELLTTPETISLRFTQMQQTAKHEIAVLDRPPYFLPDVTNVENEEHALRRGIRCRAIYDQRALDVPGRLERMRASIRDGEQARLISELPLKLALIDDSAMVSLLTHANDFRTLVIHRSALADGLYLLFELLWERASKLNLEEADDPADRPTDTTTDREILTLLAGGLPDKVIARQLGLSLRTVARRVSTLMDQLNAKTRFQAGANAAARGWLDTTPPTNDT